MDYWSIVKWDSFHKEPMAAVGSIDSTSLAGSTELVGSIGRIGSTGPIETVNPAGCFDFKLV